MKAKELDNLNQLIRQGNLVLDYDRIHFIFNMRVILNPKQKLKDYASYNTADLDANILDTGGVKDLTKTKYKLSFCSYRHEFVQLGTDKAYSKRALITKVHGDDAGIPPVFTLRSGLPKACQCPGLIEEMLKEHTILEWFQLKRKIRRHFRKCMNEGRMDSALKKMDGFKVHKDHGKLTQGILTALDKVIEALEQPMQATAGLPEQLKPFVQVEPYSNWFNQLSYIQEHIKDAKETAESLKEDVANGE